MADDSSTVLGTDWEAFSLFDSHSVSFAKHATTTKTYNDVLKLFPDFEGCYTDAFELFDTSRELASELNKRTTNNLLDAWNELMGACLKSDSDLDADLVRKVRIHALRLVNTPPSIFEGNLTLSQTERKATFTRDPIAIISVGPTVAVERHDVAQWIVAFNILGKAFEMEGWEAVYAHSLEEEVSADKPSLEIHFAGETALVTLSAKKAMRNALDYMASRPPPFLNCKQVMIAVTGILGRQLLTYTMPQSLQALQAFDWSQVVPGEPDTYPVAQQPSKLDFEKVKAVHKLVKAEKDAEAEKSGLGPINTTKSHSTYLQRWKQWRDYHAIYRHMNPRASLQMVADLAMVNLKTCKSVKDIEKVLAEDISKHLQKLKREARKAELQRKCASVAAAEAEAKVRAQQLQQERQAKEQERQQIEEQELNDFSSPPGNRRVRDTRTSRQAAKNRALDGKAKEVSEVEKRLKAVADAAKKAKEEREQLEAQKRKADVAEALLRQEAARKKCKRNDITRLNLTETPRSKANRNAGWKPPMQAAARSKGDYTAPGDLWAEDSTMKLHLLYKLRLCLVEKSLVGVPLTFSAAMSLAELDSDNSTFNERVFLYVVCLMASRQSGTDEVVEMLLNFVWDDAISPNDFVTNLKLEGLTLIIKGKDKDNDLAPKIFAFALALQTTKAGIMPSNKEDLYAIGVEEPVASQVMQQVFGSSELIVHGIHAKKILTALDMIDWEETGAKQKTEVKMVKLPAEKVKKSLRTWLRKEDRVNFYDTMEAIGGLLSAKTHGDWGKIMKTISNHFSTKEKACLQDMVERICQFYKVTKGGGRLKLAC